MRNCFLTAFVLLLFVVVPNSFTYSTQKASATRSIVFSNIATQEAYFARQTPDGFVIGITSFEVGRGTTIVVSKISSGRSLQWENNYGPGNVVAIQPLRSGGYVVLGNRAVRVGTGIDPSLVLFKLTATGSIEWSKESPRGVGPIGLKEGPSGSLFVYGYSTAYRGSVFLMKLRRDGGIIWQKQFGSKIGNLEVSFEVAKNGSAYFAFGDVSHKYHIYRMRLDGTIIWKKIYSTSIFEASSFQILKPTSDGGFIIAEGLPLVSKYDQNGNVRWARYYKASTMAVVNSMVVARNGDILLVGQIGTAGGHPDLWALKINNAGDILWSKRIGAKFVDRAFDVSVTRDNHFLIAARLGRGERQGSNAWVLKLDRNGTINSSCGLFVDDVLYQVQFPVMIREAAVSELQKPTIQLESDSRIPNTWNSKMSENCGQ
jgi:hypothetical protein